jgi:hypothetical protein
VVVPAIRRRLRVSPGDCVTSVAGVVTPDVRAPDASAAVLIGSSRPRQTNLFGCLVRLSISVYRPPPTVFGERSRGPPRSINPNTCSIERLYE